MKRDTVAVDCEKVNPKIKENGWSNASFSRLVGKYPSWYSEVKRGNTPPSPEEAAKMCILLGVAPEEILTEPADIELVKCLMEKNAKKAPDPKIEGMGAGRQALLAAVDDLTDEQCEKLLGIVLEAKKVL